MKTLEQTIIARAEAQLHQKLKTIFSAVNDFDWTIPVTGLKNPRGDVPSVQETIFALKTALFQAQRERAIETALQHFVNLHLPNPPL